MTHCTGGGVLLPWRVSVATVAVRAVVGLQLTCFISTMLRQLQRGRQVQWPLRPRLDHDDLCPVCAQVLHQYTIYTCLSSLTLLVGQQEGHTACKHWVVGYWRGYLSGARCRFAYGPADVTATLVSVKSRLVLLLCYRLIRVVPVEGPLNMCMYVQGGPKKLYVFQHTIYLEPFTIKWNGFHKNVPRVSGNKD